MGASDSSPETHGWRILEVIPNGPCWNKELCVYFDFIVGVNGQRLNTSSEEFWDIIRANQNKEIVLTIFNYKTRVKRDIFATPTNKWNGDGLLGLVIVGSHFTKCDEECIRILDIDSNSPAEKAQLISNSDYILGTPINAFTSFSIFRDTISDYLDQPLPVYVYNSEKAEIRLVEIKPDSNYIGDGVLGCRVGDGLLHHIPSLKGNQSAIKFKPVASYIVSSKNSQKRTNVSSISSSPSQSQSNSNPQPQNNEQIQSNSNPQPQNNEQIQSNTQQNTINNNNKEQKHEEIDKELKEEKINNNDNINQTHSIYDKSHQDQNQPPQHQHTIQSSESPQKHSSHTHGASCNDDDHHINHNRPFPINNQYTDNQQTLLSKLEQETKDALVH